LSGALCRCVAIRCCGMGQIRYVVGDATSPQVAGCRVVAHVCNDRGGWGKGFVMAISQRWPQPEAEYRRWYRERTVNDFALGAIQLVPVAIDLWVANMIGQHGTASRRSTSPPIRYDAVAQALSRLTGSARELGASVHMPRIGCGLAGGRWDRIEPLITQELVDHGVPVTVYDSPLSPASKP
jgi:O-acetyl-ADP-ribose deacetylase (regulator of RNase III)